MYKACRLNSLVCMETIFEMRNGKDSTRNRNPTARYKPGPVAQWDEIRQKPFGKSLITSNHNSKFQISNLFMKVLLFWSFCTFFLPCLCWTAKQHTETSNLEQKCSRYCSQQHLAATWHDQRQNPMGPNRALDVHRLFQLNLQVQVALSICWDWDDETFKRFKLHIWLPWSFVSGVICRNMSK